MKRRNQHNNFNDNVTLIYIFALHYRQQKNVLKESRT